MRAALLLSGCGVFDGSEIHEVVMTIYALEKHGYTYRFFAPNVLQHNVVNHITGQAAGESRNVLAESARIARGKIQPLTEYREDDFDTLIIPGGFGVARNLCTYASEGIECSVDRIVEEAIIKTHHAHKPIGAMCIAPVLLTKVLGEITVSIGSDEATASDINKLGGKHRVTKHGEVTVDEKNMVVTTPCYMLEATLSDIAADTEAMVLAINKLINRQ